MKKKNWKQYRKGRNSSLFICKCMVIEQLSARSANSRAPILLLFCQELPSHAHTKTHTLTHTHLSAHALRRVACAHTQHNWSNALATCGNHGSNAQKKIPGELTAAQFVCWRSPVCFGCPAMCSTTQNWEELLVVTAV